MKLLFDQNLSPRLVRLLADIFPDSDHLREVGLRDEPDASIWRSQRERFYDRLKGLRFSALECAIWGSTEKLSGCE